MHGSPGPPFACRGLCQAPGTQPSLHMLALSLCAAGDGREVDAACTRFHAENCAVCGVTLPIRPERQAVHVATGCRCPRLPSDLFPVGKRDLEWSQQAQPGWNPEHLPQLFLARAALAATPRRTSPRKRDRKRTLPAPAAATCPTCPYPDAVAWSPGSGTESMYPAESAAVGSLELYHRCQAPHR